jgi:hypothetical protein
MNILDSLTIGAEPESLAIGWFTFEDFIVKRGTEQTELTGEFLAIDLVSTEAVILFKEDPVNQIFARDDVNDGEYEYKFSWNEGMKQHTVYVADKENPIVGVDRTGGSGLVTLALQNHTILTLDLFQYAPGVKEDVILSQFDFEVDKGYDNPHNPIVSLPHENYVIFSPDTFDLFKLNKFDNKDFVKVRPRINNMRYLVTPLTAEDPVPDIYKPNAPDDPEICDRIKTASKVPYFIATGGEFGVNMVGDWTSMETLSVFSTLQNLEFQTSDFRKLGYDDQFTIESITHVGFLPRYGLYAYTPVSRNHNHLYTYSVVSQVAQKIYHNNYGLKVRHVQWINSTSLIGLFYNGDIEYYDMANNQVSYAKAFNQFSGLGADFIWTQQETFRLKFGHSGDADRGIIFGSIILEKQNNIAIGLNDFSWEDCRSLDGFSSSSQFSKIYSKYHVCEECSLFDQQADPTTFENGEIRNCVPALTCPSNQILHMKIRDDAKPDQGPRIQPSLVSDIYHQSSNNLELECLDKVVLTEDQKKFENDNGCHAGYDKVRPLGYCLPCLNYFNEFDSTCLYSQAIRDTNDLTLVLASPFGPLNLANYKYSKLTETISLKGDIETSYEEVYFSGVDKLGLEEKDLSVSKAVDNLRIEVVKSQLSQSLKKCYKVDRLFLDGLSTIELVLRQPYEYKVREKYQLDRMPIEPGLILTEDILKMETHYCWLNCTKLLGDKHFFDYETGSCRKCEEFCIECNNSTHCELCIPGYNPVQDPKYREWKGEDIERVCLPGCQNGYFVRKYDGNCIECDRDCRVCVDGSDTEFGKAEGEGDYCSVCKEKNDDDEELVLDTVTRVCIPKASCTKPIESDEVDVDGEKYNQKYCVGCVEGCARCVYTNYKKCLECIDGWALNLKTEICEKEETNALVLILIISSVLVLIVIAFCYWILIKINKDKEEGLKVKI